MIPRAREVRLKPKIRKVLEARCQAPSTPQADVKRARIVLLAAEGRSTRSIAEEVGIQPRIVSKWRWRFAEHGLGGLKDRPRASKKRIYGRATDKRILALLEKPPPIGYARWTGPLLACAVTRRRFPVGASPTRQRLQPEATGAVMEVTKWLKPSDSVSRYTVTARVCRP